MSLKKQGKYIYLNAKWKFGRNFVRKITDNEVQVLSYKADRAMMYPSEISRCVLHMKISDRLETVHNNYEKIFLPTLPFVGGYFLDICKRKPKCSGTECHYELNNKEIFQLPIENICGCDNECKNAAIHICTIDDCYEKCQPGVIDLTKIIGFDNDHQSKILYVDMKYPMYLGNSDTHYYFDIGIEYGHNKQLLADVMNIFLTKL